MLRFPKFGNQILIASLPHWWKSRVKPCQPIPSPDPSMLIEFVVRWDSAEALPSHKLYMTMVWSGINPVQNFFLLVS